MIPRYKRNKKYNKTRGVFRTNYPWKERQIIKGTDGQVYLFLHVHKTGGTSVKDFLLGKNFKKASHARAMDVIKEIGYNEFKKYKTFAVIRNPYDRVVSAYFHMRDSGRMPPSITLQQFVLDKSNKYSMHNEVCATPQYKYLMYNDKIECETLIRFENLVEDFLKFAEETKIVSSENMKTFPHDRKSKRKGYMTYFQGKPNMIKTINDFYEKDFEIFGYEKMLP